MVKKFVLWLLYSVLIRRILQVILGVHYLNRDSLRDYAQYVLVANHNSHLDTVALLAAVPAAQLARTRPVAAGDYFGKTPVKRRLTEFFVNALLIPRSRPKEGETGPDPIEMMLRALDAGNSLILFPESTRGEPGKLQKFKKGIGIILEARPDVPFVPVYMKGMGKLLPKGEVVLVPFDNYVRFGEPFYCHGMTVEQIVAKVEQEIIALAENLP